MNGEAYEQAHLCGCGESIGDGTSIARFLAVNYKESLGRLDWIGKAPCIGLLSPVHFVPSGLGCAQKIKAGNEVKT